MRLLLAMSRRGLCGFLMRTSGDVGFAKLLGAIGAIKLMALAGNANQGNSHKKHGK